MRKRRKRVSSELHAATSSVDGIPVAPLEWTRVHPATVVLALSMGVAAALLFYLGRGQTFYFDEWTLVLDRPEWTPDALLRSHNEHLFLIPILVLKLLVALVGLTPHWVFQVPVTAAHLISVALIFVLVSRRVGQWLGLAAAIVLLFLGSAWEDLLLPIQVSFVGSVAAGLAMVAVLDGAPSRARDVLSSALLMTSLACSGIGISFVAVALVEVLARPNRWRRIWIAAVPSALYGLWYAAYGQRRLEGEGTLSTNVPWVPSYLADEAAGAFGALSGLGLEWGRLLAVIGVLLLIRHVLAERVPVRLLSLLAGLMTFWIATALARAHLQDPAATRYLYVGAVYVLLISAEAWRPLHVSRRAAALVALAVVFAVVANLNLLRGGRDTYRLFSDEISARLGALEIAGPNAVQADFRPAPELAPRLYAGPYFDAIEDHGSPAASPQSLPSMSPSARNAADEVLIRALVRTGRQAGQVARSDRLEVDRVVGGTERRSGNCIELSPSAAETVLDVTVPSNGLRVRPLGDDPVRVAVRRFGVDYGRPIVGVGPSTSTVVVLSRGASRMLWRARIESEDRVEVCPTRVA